MNDKDIDLSYGGTNQLDKNISLSNPDPVSGGPPPVIRRRIIVVE
jgi:hypothetical protein